MEVSKILNKRQVKVIKLRNQGFTWKQIADIVDLNYLQQAQEIYKDSIRKLQKYKEIQDTCPELCAAFWEASFKYYTLVRLYNLLKEFDLTTTYLLMDVDDLIQFPNFGPKLMELVLVAQDIYDRSH